MNFLIFILILLGVTAISAGMTRHEKQIFAHVAHHHAPRRRHKRMLLGALLLALALIPSIAAHGLSVGIAVWFGFLALAGHALALFLAYRPPAGWTGRPQGAVPTKTS
jgi:hypothetical protein